MGRTLGKAHNKNSEGGEAVSMNYLKCGGLAPLWSRLTSVC
jgi:hypothetical protein